MNSEKLGMEESPFIHLTSNPQFIDVLCVNCYECVSFADVDRHSKVCAGKTHINADLNSKDNKYELDIERDLRKLVHKENDDAHEDENDVNEKIFKLMKAIRNRLFEVQDDKDNIDANTEDLHSNLHAIAGKVFSNN